MYLFHVLHTYHHAHFTDHKTNPQKREIAFDISTKDLNLDSAQQFWFSVQPGLFSQATVSENYVSPSCQWSDIQEVKTTLEEGLSLRLLGTDNGNFFEKHQK